MDTEQEQGTFTGSAAHHRGYYAGDFSDRPFPTVTQLRALWTLRVPAGVTPSPQRSTSSRW
jgi:hypothetical protein